MNGETFEEFRRWVERNRQRSIGEEFVRLRQICAEEGGWELPTLEREDRPNAFAEALADEPL